MTFNNSNADVASELIRTMRRSCGLTMRELAWRAKTSAAALTDYEAGRHEAKISTLQRIADAAGCDIAFEVHPRPDNEVRLDELGQVFSRE